MVTLHDNAATGGDIIVSATDPVRPVALSSTDSPGGLSFTEYGASFTITAPAGALNLTMAG